MFSFDHQVFTKSYCPNCPHNKLWWFFITCIFNLITMCVNEYSNSSSGTKSLLKTNEVGVNAKQTIMNMIWTCCMQTTSKVNRVAKWTDIYCCETYMIINCHFYIREDRGHYVNCVHVWHLATIRSWIPCTNWIIMK